MAAPSFRPSTAFADLGPDFADPVAPAAFPAPVLRYRDLAAARRAGLLDDAGQGPLDMTEASWLARFARFTPLPGAQPEPLAMRYHGHQFRVYNPQIGDGRGFLYAQCRDADGGLLDIGTKGTGQTPYSRSGDGRMTLQAGVRESLAAAYLRAAGAPGCAILALVETREPLHRDDEASPTRGAALTRLQRSLVRIGTFQRHAYVGRPDLIARLVAYCITHYFPEIVAAPVPEQPARLLGAAVEANARLVARWTLAGFVHGVLNSDNMTLTGESFDYGPFRFLAVYEPGFTAAYFDQAGLYAFGRQAEAALWNLARLAECLALIAEEAGLRAALEGFDGALRTAIGEAVCARLGVAQAGAEADFALFFALARFLKARRAPFEGALFDWRGGEASRARAMNGPRAAWYTGALFDAFAAQLFARAPTEAGAPSQPYFQSEEPVALTIDVLRGVWEAIAVGDDWAPFAALHARIRAMAEAYGASG